MISRSSNQNLLVKFDDDLTLSIPVKAGDSNSNSAANEIQSIVEWITVNRMQLNKLQENLEDACLKENPSRLYQFF